MGTKPKSGETKLLSADFSKQKQCGKRIADKLAKVGHQHRKRQTVKSRCQLVRGENIKIEKAMVDLHRLISVSPLKFSWIGGVFA